MKSSIIEILFEVIRKTTVPSKELLPQQAGELLYGSMGSPIAKQLCRLAAELKQEAEDKNIPFLGQHSDHGPLTYNQPRIVKHWPGAIGGWRPARSRIASATRSGGMPTRRPEYCTCISVATRPGQTA